MEQIPARKEITSDQNFVFKNNTKFLFGNVIKLESNIRSEFGTDANKLGSLIPDIAIQMAKIPLKKNDRIWYPAKIEKDIWLIRYNQSGEDISV